MDLLSARVGTDTRATSGVNASFSLLGGYLDIVGSNNENSGTGWSGYDWRIMKAGFSASRMGNFGAKLGGLMGAEASYNVGEALACTFAGEFNL